MKWKILIKLLYLIALFSIAAIKWEREGSKLIDSEPQINRSEMQQAFQQA